MDVAERRPGFAFMIALGLSALITPLAVHMFFPVIPAVKAAFGLSNAFAQLTFSVALFGMAFTTLVYGSLSDRYGRRSLLLSGMALFLIGSVVSAFAPTAATLVAGRLVQAIGAGCALTLTRAIARDAYRAEQLVTAIAYLTMFGTLGPMIAPAVGGILVDTLGWRSVFGFALVAGGAITIIAYFALYETHPPAKRRVDDVSMLQSYVALLRRPRFNAFVCQTGFLTATFMVMASASSSLMAGVLQRPATEFGLYFLLFPIGFCTGSVIATRIGNRVSAETMLLVGSSIALASLAVQVSALYAGFLTPLVLFIPGSVVTLGQGLSLPYAQVGAMAEIPRFAGTGAGIGVFMQHFLSAAAAQLYGFFADGTPHPMMVVVLGCGLLSFLFSIIPMLLKIRGAVAPAV